MENYGNIFWSDGVNWVMDRLCSFTMKPLIAPESKMPRIAEQKVAELRAVMKNRIIRAYFLPKWFLTLAGS